MPAITTTTIVRKDILIVDDEIANLKLLAELLEQQGYKVRPLDRPELAINSALADPPGLILLDVRMPEIDGFGVCWRLKQDERTRDVPVIFISALQDAEDKVRGFEVGAVDFISKPFQEQEVLARVQTHLELRNMQMHLEEMVATRTAEVVEREERFRATFEQAAVGVAHVNPNGKFLRLNRKFCEIVGYQYEELINLTFQDITHPDELEIDVGNLQRLLAHEIRHYSRDKRYRCKDGSTVWVNLTVSLVSDEQDEAKYFVSVITDISKSKTAELELKGAYAEIKELQSQLEAESNYLQEEIKLEHNFDSIIGQSDPLKYVLQRVEMVAPQDSVVIITGETGTGKELIARSVHQLSARNGHPLVKVNCAVLPDDLIESELFGREKGAFTGATTTQIGRFELAKNSTIFLDEIGELRPDVQAKLLRVLESGKFERLGNPRTFTSDARIIAATNRKLEEEVRQKRFREDLWYRLKVFPITVPPLRNRVEDIPLLVDHFVREFSRKMGKKYEDLKVTSSSMRALQSYHWPGNIRELKHVVEAAVIATPGGKLEFDIPTGSDPGTDSLKSFSEMERDYLLKVLNEVNWKVTGENSASAILGMPSSTLRSRMKKLGIKRP